MQDTDKRDEYLATAITKASLLLEGETPRLIDEWQDAPTLWDAVRVACDRRQKPGHTQNSVDMQSINLCGNSIFANFTV